MALGAAMAHVSAAPALAELERGAALFTGVAPMHASIGGHQTPLPPAATRCMNCHAAGTAEPGRAASATTASFGPLLTRERLLERSARRGGPPSRYDEATLCRLLRTGIDPAYVLIPRDMPRFELADADCRALWVYLTRQP